MDAFRQALRDAKATATNLSNEIVPKLNEDAEFEDAVPDAQGALSSIRSAIRTLPDEIRGESRSETAKSAVMESARTMSSLLDGVADSVPRQDLTFRDKASEIKNGLTKLEEAAEAAMTAEGGRRRRRKTRKGKKGKKRATRASRRR
jgi:hypothetical protein